MCIEAVLETSLYFAPGQFESVRAFYDEILQLGRHRVVDRDPVAYRIGATLLLLFDYRESAAQESPPGHGARGPGHLCLRVAPNAYEGWRRRIAEAGIEILEESSWQSGAGRSFYFHDPAGNVLEIADRDFWPSGDNAPQSSADAR